MTIWDEVAAERVRAHRKHGETSMEEAPPDALFRATILNEEIGEAAEILAMLALVAAGGRVSQYLNDQRHHDQLDQPALRRELIQIAAMAGGWADRIESTPNLGENPSQLERLIDVACYDPGRFTPRAQEYTEEIWRWQARAVKIVVTDPVRAAAAL